MTRRLLLRRLFHFLGIGATGVIARFSGGADDAVAGPLRAVLDPSDSTTLSASDMNDLVAFAEVLVEGRALAPAERGYLMEHIEARTTGNAEYLSLYRTAAGTLERLAGRRVASLNVRERLELVARHRLGSAEVRPGEDLGTLPDEMRAVRTRVAPDLIGGYYASPAGWAAVGYSTFPGRCGDLTRYVGPAT